MTLVPRRPPAHGNRKAFAYAADIVRLREEGHSYEAIREALEDAGVAVSITTVRREVLAASRAPVGAVSTHAPSAPRFPSASQDPAISRAQKHAPSKAATLPGRAIAEEFVRGHDINPLFLKEPAP